MIASAEPTHNHSRLQGDDGLFFSMSARGAFMMT
jgi:hypothetical protein